MIFYTGGVELSNNARGYPIACILPLDCLTSDFWSGDIPIEFLREMKCVYVPENPPHTPHTHSHTRAHTNANMVGYRKQYNTI